MLCFNTLFMWCSWRSVQEVKFSVVFEQSLECCTARRSSRDRWYTYLFVYFLVYIIITIIIWNRDSTVCTIMKLRTERSGDRFPARTRLFLLPNTTQPSLGSTWKVVVSCLGIGYSWLPYLYHHHYTPSTGVSTTTWDASAKVTNLVATQVGPTLTCNYYPATCSVVTGVSRDEAAS